MKRIYPISITLITVCLFFFAGCELDNYEGPDASLFGEIKDLATGELIQQDVDNGSKIIIRELGFENPAEQQMIFKENGQYRNHLVFAAEYDIYFNESNFVRPDTLKAYRIRKGENRLDFPVQPYIRVSDVSILKSGNEIVATFTITPTVSNPVKQIGLFGHIDRIVGNPYALKRKTEDIDLSSKDVPVVYTLTFNTDGFQSGREYFFRVGGLIDVANAKYNYAPSVRIVI